jgi:hypothetical protein
MAKACEVCGSPLSFKNSFVYKKKEVCKDCLKKLESGQSVQTTVKPPKSRPGFSAGTCWFCSTNAPSPGANIKVEMHMVVGGEQTIAYPVLGVKQVRYRKDTITVPRCKACKEEHEVQKSDLIVSGVYEFIIGAITIGTGIISGILTCRIIRCGSAWPGVIAGIIIGITAGLLAAKLRFKYFPPRESPIEPKNHYVNYPLIERKIADGWQLGEKPLL